MFRPVRRILSRAPLSTPLPAAMNARLSLLAAAFLSFALCAPVSAATVELFHETFDTNLKAWSNGSAGSAAYDEDGWTESGSVRAGMSGVLLGTSSATGTITTKSINIQNEGEPASLAVTIQAAGYYGGGANPVLSVTAIDNDGTHSWTFDLEAATSTSNAIPNTDVYFCKIQNYAPSGSFQLVLTTGAPQKANFRTLIGDVLVTQEINTGRTQLVTPTSLSATSTNYFGFALSWDPVTHATNGYTVTLSPAEGNSGVTVSGTTATMTGLTEGGTYDVSVVAKGDGTGTDDSEAAELRGVTTLTAPPVSQPDLMSTVSASALTISWPAQNDAAFSVLAWTNKPVNVASQDFAGYAANGTVPEGWVFENSRNHYPNENAPVDFRADGNWIASPEFGGPVETVSFHVAAAGTVTNSHFFVYGTTGTTDRDDWILLSEVTDSETGKLVSEQKTISVSPSAGIKRIIFQYQKDQGNVRIGTFSVTGTGVGKEPVYLIGYGPDPTDVNATSVTFANPVVGETYYVEVTATGLSGKTAATTLPVAVPAVSTPKPAVISVK